MRSILNREICCNKLVSGEVYVIKLGWDLDVTWVVKFICISGNKMITSDSYSIHMDGSHYYYPDESAFTQMGSIISITKNMKLIKKYFPDYEKL
jgi:hypothetical protein